MTDMIAVRGVTKSFGKTAVLHGIDLTVARGEIVALLGPNGAGKTTLINILSTLVAPDAGTATIAGYDVVRAARAGQGADQPHRAVRRRRRGAHRRREPAHDGQRSPASAAPRPPGAAASCSSGSSSTDSARKRVKTYCGGMRRRLDLAISLLSTPPVVFLDEPTTGLDPASRQELWAVIRHLADNGTTVLLTTQYLEEADQLADRIAVLEGGRIVAEGTPGDLKSRIGGEVVALHDADGALVREIPTDGTVAGLRAALDGLDDAAAASVILRARAWTTCSSRSPERS